MIDARNLTIFMEKRELLRDLSFAIRRGEFVAIVGPNGVGKTTLLKTVAGLHAALCGELAIDGRELRAYTSAERARAIAFLVSEPTALEGLSVREVVAIGRFPHHRWWEWTELEADAAGIRAALDAVDMQPFAQRPFATLSTGERQRAWLALALAQETPVLLLDEPTSHLDVRASQQILRVLARHARSGKTVVCALHDLNEALAFADRLLILGDGVLLHAGTPANAVESGAFDRAYGVRFEVARSTAGVRVFPIAEGTPLGG